MPFLLAEILNF